MVKCFREWTVEFPSTDLEPVEHNDCYERLGPEISVMGLTIEELELEELEDEVEVPSRESCMLWRLSFLL